MKIYVPADGEMCNVHHDLDCCGRKFNRPDPHTKGIAEGLLMATEIVRKHTVKKAIFNSHPDGYALNDEILNKAKEVEELKGEK